MLGLCLILFVSKYFFVNQVAVQFTAHQQTIIIRRVMDDGAR